MKTVSSFLRGLISLVALPGLFLLAGLALPASAQPADPAPSPAAQPPAGVSEQVVKLGSGEWQVTGALTMPAGTGPFPAIVLVHGSGPGTLDMNVGGSTIFRDLAWGLAARGIAVVRYTKRTTEHRDHFKSLRKPPTLEEEFIEDASSAAMLLKNTPRVDPDRVYVFGNSQGGMVAATIANRNGLAGAVVMASSPRPIGDILIQQADYVTGIATDPEQKKRAAEIRRNGERINALTAADDADEIIHGSPVWYWRDMAAIDPIGQMKRLTDRGGRALIMHGDRDYLITAEDWAAWKEALEGRRGVTLKAYPRLNHIMQEGEGRMTPDEYEWTRPVSSQFIDDIAGWLQAGNGP
ncbi:alpha/beta hydrolase family protein [Sphingosinicella rhizophila]|uniref:Alpha/beta fold hydrolase n=1 Tax=Sphingosinicella rhizophila TaxID=3050082 RepID=A0ABU3QBD0_9SPHN|nr:alpha/beta fold hydrolase [Sphingosinicella sp. GR2756]MDT9600602.1 alpha/beta fold hydrolase [Sphingosinicella sp. GR2756]